MEDELRYGQTDHWMPAVDQYVAVRRQGVIQNPSLLVTNLNPIRWNQSLILYLFDANTANRILSIHLTD